MLKKTILIVGFLCFSFAQAQVQFNEKAPWMSTLDIQARKLANTPLTFQEQVDAFNAYWETHDPNTKGSGYKPFKRWQEYWKNFVKEDGTLPNSEELWQTYLSTKGSTANRSFMTDLSDWQPVGPFTHTNTGSWSSGQGRVNVIVKDPINSNTYYVGAPAGGFWKSTDSGSTWSTSTDLLPQIGVSGIAIDPNNSQIIYIATGDDDAGDTSSIGVMKSTDGGTTWNATGLNTTNTPSSMNDIYVHPTNSNILWVATSSGVYKSTDAGVSWSNTNGTQNLNIKDVKIKPGDPNTLYAVTNSQFYKSVDGGNNFTYTGSASNLPLSNVSRYVIDVTPANANVVYLLAANGGNSFRGLYKSTNSGLTFTEVANTNSVGDIFESQQSWYDMAFAVSDTNENEVFAGVLNIWKGTVLNDQASFVKINNWSSPNSSTYTHADIHYLRFFNGELLVGSDGGFYKSVNAGISFTDLTSGMQIGQFYRIAVSKQSSSKMVGGLQDNGGYAFNNNQWQNYYGADGMDTAINPQNSSQYYGFIQNGSSLNISTSSGGSITGQVAAPAGEQGNWITPLVMNSDSELYAGYSRLYRLDNNAWTVVAPTIAPGVTGNINNIEIDDLNPDNIYLSIGSTLYKSTDRGLTYNNVENFASTITSIEVNTENSSIIYVTTSGFSGTVNKSTDGGLNFSNISTGLPSGITKNRIKHQGLHPDNPLFLGTSLGVYRYDDTTLSWELFNNGLPNVAVTDIEINILDNKITAATYGRGVWQSVIPTQLSQKDLKLTAVLGINDAITCNGTINPQISVENNGLDTINTIEINYTVDNVVNTINWTGSLASQASENIAIPELTLAKGIHTFTAEATTVNDTYAVNNTSEDKNIYVNAPEEVLVVNTFEADSDNLLISEDNYWTRGVPTGVLLNNSSNPTNPTNKVYGTNLSGNYSDGIKSYLYSGCYDLTTIGDPILEFDMAFDLEEDWDIVYVEYSTNQGETWSHLGTAEDPNWYNSNVEEGENETCTNCKGAQWTGTNSTLTGYSYNLVAQTNETNIIFRFVFHSDYAVNQEGVIIDNLVISGQPLSVETFKTTNFSIYPNPSEGVFNIKAPNTSSFNLSVSDVTGKQIFRENRIIPSNDEYKLNLSNYASGVYFLTISSENNKVTKKLILN